MGNTDRINLEIDLRLYNEKIEKLRSELLLHIEELQNVLVLVDGNFIRLKEIDKFYAAKIAELKNFILTGDDLNGDVFSDWMSALEKIFKQVPGTATQRILLLDLLGELDALMNEKTLTEIMLSES